MEKSLMYDRALAIATEAHAKQTRKKSAKRNGGTPEAYIEHPKRVTERFLDDERRTLSILHDVIEDHPEFAPIIKKEFPKEIYDDLLLLSKKDGENYFDFITRIIRSGNIRVMKIKIEDITDNSRDIDEGAKKDKYRFALHLLNISIYLYESTGESLGK